ncbi:hypothetical protein HAX54_029087, partial [Datura stramonium]|nr:hypothetical protein [Datura stramonium]
MEDEYNTLEEVAADLDSPPVCPMSGETAWFGKQETKQNRPRTFLILFVNIVGTFGMDRVTFGLGRVPALALPSEQKCK